jgi:hypothetical protein
MRDRSYRHMEASMARTAVGTLENPSAVDEIIRNLEDSGYPVDGSTGEFIRQPDDPFVATDEPVADATVPVKPTPACRAVSGV